MKILIALSAGKTNLVFHGVFSFLSIYTNDSKMTTIYHRWSSKLFTHHVHYNALLRVVCRNHFHLLLLLDSSLFLIFIFLVLRTSAFLLATTQLHLIAYYKPASALHLLLFFRLPAVFHPTSLQPTNQAYVSFPFWTSLPSQSDSKSLHCPMQHGLMAKADRIEETEERIENSDASPHPGSSSFKLSSNACEKISRIRCDFGRGEEVGTASYPHFSTMKPLINTLRMYFSAQKWLINQNAACQILPVENTDAIGCV